MFLIRCSERDHFADLINLTIIFGHPVLSCLGRMTPGVKDTPFLGSAWGAKEAVDLSTGGSLSMVSMQESRNKHTMIYLGSGRPKANIPTPACLDRCHHGGERFTC